MPPPSTVTQWCFECERDCSDAFIGLKVKYLCKNQNGNLKRLVELSRVYCLECGADFLLLDEQAEDDGVAPRTA